MSAQLSLLDANATAVEERTRKDRWLVALRTAVLNRYRGHVISTDDVWRVMEGDPSLRIPDGMSSNVLGGFFTDWPHAEKTGHYLRSERDGSHGNLLTIWRLS